jgi:uncharacterized membrane protein
MKTQHAVIAAVVLMVVTVAYSAALWPALPDRIPTHWNMHGQVDGWGSRAFGAWFVPTLMVAMGLLMVGLPWLSPKSFKVDDFRHVYNYVMVMILVMFVGMHVVMLQAALHPTVDVGKWLIVGLCGFLALIGNVMSKVRRNFWMGIRTPWTLADDRVWVATHRFGARTMVASGALGALIVGLGGSPVAAFVLIMVGALAPCLYSLVIYKRFEAEGKA